MNQARMEAPAAPLRLSTREGYDRWSEIYDTEDNPLVALEESALNEFVDSVRGKRALDVGCGTGRHAIRLWRRGVDVTAVDFAGGMLARAREKAAGTGIRFIEHDLAHPLPFEDGRFDAVLCALVLDHIADLDGLFCEMKRVCRPSGRVVASVMHPAMMLKGVQARFHDPATGREVRPASQPHQVSDYLMAGLRAGLRLERVGEYLADEELARRSPRAQKHLGWPLLLTMFWRV